MTPHDASAKGSRPETSAKVEVGNDIAFAVGIVVILTILFIPLPAVLIDVGLAFSISLAVLVLMMALWIGRPLDFTAFPVVLLIATMLRLSLNVATTRLILSEGYEGPDAAGHVIAGFANFIMGGDFVIGVIVFLILVTVNFLVITKGVLGQFGGQPRAMLFAGIVVGILGLAPGLPLLPFVLLGLTLLSAAYIIPSRQEALRRSEQLAETQKNAAAAADSVVTKELLRAADLELVLGGQLAGLLLGSSNEIATRVARIRRKFALQYGFVIPEVKVSDDLTMPAKSYSLKLHGTAAAVGSLRPGEVLVAYGGGKKPSFPGDVVAEPAFGMPAMWVPEMFSVGLRQEGFTPVDNLSVLLTHFAEMLRANLGQLFSYRDLRALIDRLDPDYRKLIDEICPSQITNSSLQAVLKYLLAERVSIRNFHLIIEAIAEISPFTRKVEVIAEHVRSRLGHQICGDLADAGQLKVIRLSNRWESAFHQALKRDAKGDVIEFDLDPRLVEAFSTECSAAVSAQIDHGHKFAVVTSGEVRPYVRMVVERIFPTVSVISLTEISRTNALQTLSIIA